MTPLQKAADIKRQIIKQSVEINRLQKPNNYAELPINQIKVMPEKYQYREQVDESVVSNIVEHFDPYQLTPIIVRQTESGEFELLAGHHRLEALKRLGEKEIPAAIYRVNEEKAMEIAKKSNAMATEYTPLEFGQIFRTERAKGKSARLIAKEYNRKSPTEVENYISLTNLSVELQQLIKDKGLPVPHGIVLGKAVETYSIPSPVQMEIFQKFIKVNDLTPTELSMALDTIAPKVSEQIDLGLTGLDVVRGWSEPINEIMKEIKSISRKSKAFKSVIRQIDRMRKAKEEIPEDIQKAYDSFRREVKKSEDRLLELQRSIGQGKPEIPRIKSRVTMERREYWQRTIDGKYEKVIIKPKKGKIVEKQLTLWRYLTNPRLELPLSAYERKLPEVKAEKFTQTEMDFQVPQEPTPEILINSAVDTALKERTVVNINSIKIEKPEDTVSIIHQLKEPKKETVIAVSLDGDENVIGVHIVSIGTVDQSVVDAINVFDIPRKLKAKEIVLLHNHPSGIVNPSVEDIEVTKSIKEYGNTIGISLKYHIITDGDKYNVMFSGEQVESIFCLLYTSPSPRDLSTSRMPSSA